MTIDEIVRWIERDEGLSKWHENWAKVNLGEASKRQFVRNYRQRLEDKIRSIRFGE